MSFCGPLGMPVILRPDWNACYFAAGLECLLFCGRIFVPNLFCGRIGMPVILRFDFLDITVRHEIGKRYNQVCGFSGNDDNLGDCVACCSAQDKQLNVDFLDRLMLSQGDFNFAQFNPKTAQFNLIIKPSKIFNLTIRAITR